MGKESPGPDFFFCLVALGELLTADDLSVGLKYLMQIMMSASFTLGMVILVLILLAKMILRGGTPELDGRVKVCLSTYSLISTSVLSEVLDPPINTSSLLMV